MNKHREVKNFIHNELGITKDDIREMVEESVEKIVERKLEVMFHKYWDGSEPKDSKYSLWTIQRIIDDTIRDKSRLMWGESETKLEDYIKQQVVRELLKGVKLKVEVAKTKKDATPGPETMTIRRYK